MGEGLSSFPSPRAMASSLLDPALGDPEEAQPAGDTTFTKVFVGGLPWETESEGLLEHFKQHGEIVEAVVIRDRQTGRSKGYGFVTYFTAEEAQRAVLDTNPIIDGRKANCNLAAFGKKRSDAPRASGKDKGKGGKDAATEVEETLLCGCNPHTSRVLCRFGGRVKNEQRVHGTR